jgi:hypothetical protein
MRATLVLLACLAAAPAEAQDKPQETTRGRLYVPVYSSISAGSGATRIDLAATLSLRNLSPAAAVTVERVDYHDTAGKRVRAYLEKPAQLPPLGTYEAVIAERDVAGGTGAKFLIDWSAPAGAPEPLAEAVMIGVHGAHSFSFVSVGRAAPRAE